MTYSELKAAIAEVIKTNYNQEITAVVLQDLLDSMVGMTRAQDERVLGEARDYTDEREVVIREDFAAADAATLASAGEYTNGREGAIRTDFAAADAETLQSAKDYADTHKVDKTKVGAAGGVASLDAGGLVPSSQLPSYVDDVLEYPSPGDFPSTGEEGKIYVTKDTNLTYRWSGTGTWKSPNLWLWVKPPLPLTGATGEKQPTTIRRSGMEATPTGLRSRACSVNPPHILRSRIRTATAADIKNSGPGRKMSTRR